MDVLVESTKGFEEDLSLLDKAARDLVVSEVNAVADFLPIQDSTAIPNIRPPYLSLDLNGYESSLCTLNISHQLNVVLAVDNDPIFGQVILSLFRIVKQEDLAAAYQEIANSLYKDLVNSPQEIAPVSSVRIHGTTPCPL